MDDLFSHSISSSDSEYLALRDEARHAELREYCIALWEKFRPFADRSFCREFALHPHQRFWEMYLGARLIDLGFELIPRKLEKGPDLHLFVNNQHVWIEATLPSEGSTDDSVPTLRENLRFNTIPEEKIILRFTSAISYKRDKLANYIQSGIIQPDDAFVIGIGGGAIELLSFDASPIPAVIKSVYPIGQHQVKFDNNNMEVIEEHYALRQEIQKANNSTVATNAFIDPDYSSISGILYSDVSLIDYSTELNNEFLFIHNYLASVPLNKGWLKAGKDCWIDGDRLVIS